MERASVFRTAGAIRALLVYRKTSSDIAAIRVFGLQRSARRAARRVSMGWGGRIEDGEVDVGVTHTHRTVNAVFFTHAGEHRFSFWRARNNFPYAMEEVSTRH